MPRRKEDKVRVQFRMRSHRKNEWDKRLINAGFSYESKGKIYPLYGEFLEELLLGDPKSKAMEVIFQ